MLTAHLAKVDSRLNPRQIILYLKHVCHIPPSPLITTIKYAGMNINFIADNFPSPVFYEIHDIHPHRSFSSFIYFYFQLTTKIFLTLFSITFIPMSNSSELSSTFIVLSHRAIQLITLSFLYNYFIFFVGSIRLFGCFLMDL